MVYLILCIICSASLYLIFKGFESFNINLLQAIVTNYFIASTCGFLLAWYSEPRFSISAISESNWLLWAVLIGAMFISIFNLMGISSQRSGIGVTSMANKMSVVIPVLAGIVIFHEELNFNKTVGLILAIAALILTTYKPNEKSSKKQWLFPLIIFFCSGILDALVGYSNKKFVNEHNSATFTASLFFFAFVLGLIFLCVSLIRNRNKIEFKNIVGGIILGIPNFGSILFIFLAMESSEMNMATFFPVMNIGVVVCSFFAGVIFFRERVNWLNIAGITAAIVSIGLISFT